jgi:hypothetical protein
MGQGFEMGVLGQGQKGALGGSASTVFTAVTTGSPTKEDLAMAKWRVSSDVSRSRPFMADRIEMGT